MRRFVFLDQMDLGTTNPNSERARRLVVLCGLNIFSSCIGISPLKRKFHDVLSQAADLQFLQLPAAAAMMVHQLVAAAAVRSSRRCRHSA